MGKFDDCFKPRKFSDIEERMRNKGSKKIMYRATDSDVRQAFRGYGYGNSSFRRIGDNVVIALGDIVVIIKTRADMYESVYIINGEYLPINETWKEAISEKRWATREVLEDIQKAEVFLSLI